MYRHHLSRLSALLIAAALLLAALPTGAARAAGPLCYVNDDAAGTNAGTSWTNAYTDLQSALADAGCTEIWVAAGTYKPTAGVDRTLSFVLKTGVEIYGGFAGVEVLLSQRNWTSNLTTLSGQIGAGGDLDNSYHVVEGGGADNTAVLDGFTITKGWADGASTDSSGAGMYNGSSDPVLANLIFTDNYAQSSGGGMANLSSEPEVTNVTFSLNTAGLFGGGMHNSFSSPVMNNVTFDTNDAGADGGGMVNQQSSAGSYVSLTNVTFYNNTAGDTGGGMYNSFSDPRADYVTFSGNSAGTDGGAIYADAGDDMLITNGIFWGDGTEVFVQAGASISLTDSIVEGGCPAGGTCTNVISSDPLLGAFQNNGGDTGTLAPGSGSPAIDAGGANSACIASDQRGVARPRGAACDIGAVESTLQFGPAYSVNESVDSDDGSCDAPVTGITDCTLREAINAANAMSGDNTISFNAEMGSSTIFLGSTLPTITDAAVLTIDGGGDITIDGGDVHRLFNNNTGAGPVLVLQYLTLANGYASTGGAIHNTSSLTVSYSTLRDNTAHTNAGGAILNNSGGSLTVDGSTFSSNTAAGRGGAISNGSGSTAVISNSTFSGNSGGNVGGGALASAGAAAISNSTLSGNTVTAGSGGGINATAGTLQLFNTIIANSPAGGDCVDAAAVTANNNLIESAASACGLTNGVDGNLTGSDPALDALTGFPGWFPLNAASPAIGAGDNAVCAAAPVNNQSQNGLTRPQGTLCDMGSYEFEVPDPSIDVFVGAAGQGNYLVNSTDTTVDSYSALIDGPVRVVSNDSSPAFTSQRVSSGASYNELMGVPPAQFTTEYWFPFYDHGYPGVGGSSMRTWILVGNPDDALTANVDIFIGGALMGSYAIAPGDNVTPRWVGLQDGPVHVVSDIPVFASERVFTVPNSSFNEVMGYPANQFTTEYWFPWYDSVNMNASILVGNASGSSSADVNIYIGSSFMGNYTLPANDTLIQSYPAVVDGPVRVVVTNGVDVVASASALSGPVGSFTAYNEVMGYPFDQFDTEYWFPWYDHGYPSVGGSNMRTWILVGNPSGVTTANVDILIDGALQGSYAVAPGSRITPRWIGLQDGPVQVVSDIPVFASERVFTSPDNVFNEMMGYPASNLAAEYWFAWYDSVNMSNDILIARP